MERNLYDYRDIAARYDDVAAALTELQTDVLDTATPDAADADADDDEGAVAELHAEIAGFHVGREVNVVAGEINRLGPHAMHLPVRWTSVDAPALFPAMEGVIEISAQSEHPPRTQVAFVGHYTPPLGAVGSLGDALVGHNVAASAIAHLLDEVAARLERAASHPVT